LTRLKKENFYVVLENDETRDRQRTGTAEQDREILRGACHIRKQLMFPEKKNFIVLGDSFRYIQWNMVPTLVSVLFTVYLTKLNCMLSKVLVSTG